MGKSKEITQRDAYPQTGMNIISANSLIKPTTQHTNAVVLYIVELKICTCGIEFVI